MELRQTWKLRFAALSVLALACAAAVRAEPPKNDAQEDALPLESQWKGKLTQIAKSPGDVFFPPELNAILTITERSGDEFAAELRESAENLDITFLVRGRIVRAPDKSLSIEFKSFDVKGVPNAGVYYINVPYRAKLTGDDLKGTWAYEDKDDQLELTGEITLKRGEE